MITQRPFFRFPFASCSSFLTLTHSLLSSCHHHRHLSRTTPTTSRTISSVSRLPQHPSTLSTPALACPPHIRPLISPILFASRPSTKHIRRPEMDPTDLDDRPTRGLHMGMDSAELRPPLVHHPHAHAPRQLSLRSWMVVKARRRRGRWKRVLRPLHSVRRSFCVRSFSIATSCPTSGHDEMGLYPTLCPGCISTGLLLATTGASRCSSRRTLRPASKPSRIANNSRRKSSRSYFGPQPLASSGSYVCIYRALPS